ncbi:MAG: SDR family oxidoreductase [Candidatus Spechtbacteria bacterium]|nr:SDR family oxidoreductase [Candidatus Spechtbacteria bacterium]
MANILLTGGAGFIGSHLTERLINDGNKVTIIDNLSTGKRENIDPRAEFFNADISDFETMKPLFKNKEVVFHVAAIPSVPRSIENPKASFEANIMGTLHVLLAARDCGVRRVIYSASSSAYGNQESLPLREIFAPNPLSPYAISKLVGEQLCRQFTNLYGLDTISLRYFNVYGPRMNEGAYAAVVATFLKQRKAGKPLTICGDGNQRRDFTYVSDVVEANARAMNIKRAGGEVVNIGAGDSHTIRELAEFVGGEVISMPERPGEIKESLADIAKAKKILDWEPKVSLKEGIEGLLSA